MRICVREWNSFVVIGTILLLLVALIVVRFFPLMALSHAYGNFLFMLIEKYIREF